MIILFLLYHNVNRLKDTYIPSLEPPLLPTTLGCHGAPSSTPGII